MGRVRENLAWSASQRRVIAGLLVIVMVVIAWRAWRHPHLISDPPPKQPARAELLADRIDPNTADETALASLPGIGPARARAIIAYRQAHAERGTATPAFARAEDLLKISGFGVALVDELREHLMFPPPAVPPE